MIFMTVVGDIKRRVPWSVLLWRVREAHARLSAAPRLPWRKDARKLKSGWGRKWEA